MTIDDTEIERTLRIIVKAERLVVELEKHTKLLREMIEEEKRRGE